MTAVTIDSALSVAAAPTDAVSHSAPVDTAVVVAAARTSAIQRTVNLSSPLTATASTTSVTNQSLSIRSALTVTASKTSTLYPPVEFFVVTADLNAIVADYVDTDVHPDQTPISAFIDFIPRLSRGQVIWIPGQGVVLAPIRARFDPDGILRTVIGGNGVELTANTPILGLPELVYDVVFSNVTYNRGDQYIAPFAFTAPTVGGITVDLAAVTKLPPKAP